jgi:hypothetical protein
MNELQPITKEQLKQHNENELKGFMTALDEWFLAKAKSLNIIHAKNAMPLDKATTQLSSYIKPLLCFDE